jgi:hypothetical protein
LIDEKQAKLWHTKHYDSEFRLKKLYVRMCKALPCYGAKLYDIKQLVRGNTSKKVKHYGQREKCIYGK